MSDTAVRSDRAVESWLVALLTALVPLVAALFVAREWRTPLHVAGGVLCLVGVVMLVLHERAARRGNALVTNGR